MPAPTLPPASSTRAAAQGSSAPGSTPSASRRVPLRAILTQPRDRRSRSGGVLRLAVVLLPILLLAGCASEPEWSPLEGPWDPAHPDAAALLLPPDPGDPIDPAMADAGERWYRVRGCLACHRVDGVDVAGPALNGVTVRREYDWFRAMVLRPDSMIVADPVARELLEIYRVPMPVQGVNDLHVRAIWEYLRRVDRAGSPPGAPRPSAPDA
jgi:mono/diheme cytochrome c family protein